MNSDSKMLGEAEGIGLLMRVPLRLTVEIGSCRMPVSEILRLGAGAVVELDRGAEEPVDLLVNGRPIARGEIVAVDERFALRVTEVLEPPGER